MSRFDVYKIGAVTPDQDQAEISPPAKWQLPFEPMRLPLLRQQQQADPDGLVTFPLESSIHFQPSRPFHFRRFVLVAL